MNAARITRETTRPAAHQDAPHLQPDLRPRPRRASGSTWPTSPSRWPAAATACASTPPPAATKTRPSTTPPRERSTASRSAGSRFASFGKKSHPHPRPRHRRLHGPGALRRPVHAATSAGIFFSTSPPLIGLVARIVGRASAACRSRTGRWTSTPTSSSPWASSSRDSRSPRGASKRVNRFILRRVRADRRPRPLHGRPPRARAPTSTHKMLVMPPWPHEDHAVEPVGPPPTQSRSASATASPASSSSCTAATTAPQPARHAAASRRAAARTTRRPLPLRRRRACGKKEVEAFIREHTA